MEIIGSHEIDSTPEYAYYRSCGMLTIAQEIKREQRTKSGIIVPQDKSDSIPLRAEALAVPLKLMKEGILPGDTLLFTCATREKLTIEFQPELENPRKLLAIPTECILTFIPASDDVRAAAIEKLKAQYQNELLELFAALGSVENVSVKNEWRYG